MAFEPTRTTYHGDNGKHFYGGSEAYSERFLRQLACGIEPDREIEGPKNIRHILSWMQPGDFGLNEVCRVMAYCLRRFGPLDEADPDKFFGGMILTSPDPDIRVGLLFRGTSVGVQPLISTDYPHVRQTDPCVAEAVFETLTALLEPVYVWDEGFNIVGQVD